VWQYFLRIKKVTSITSHTVLEIFGVLGSSRPRGFRELTNDKADIDILQARMVDLASNGAVVFEAE
jgi:hypothetical protein